MKSFLRIVGLLQYYLNGVALHFNVSFFFRLFIPVKSVLPVTYDVWTKQGFCKRNGYFSGSLNSVTLGQFQCTFLEDKPEHAQKCHPNLLFPLICLWFSWKKAEVLQRYTDKSDLHLNYVKWDYSRWDLNLRK